MDSSDTIAAIATGTGGALAAIRISGADSIAVADKIFRAVSGGPLSEAKGYTLHYGEIRDGATVVDDVIVSLFRAPRSFTGEDMVEISCHGSRYIQQRIMALLVGGGARQAQAGEFTVRAFLSGKLDLSQAEAIADIIASSDRTAHMLAANQMRGGYSAEFAALRRELVELASLLELELDFGEEDVEFADRAKLQALIRRAMEKIESLTGTFDLSNAIKEGVTVVIAGKPNVGKSTLLNTLLKDDRAMVSDIAGTTRDTIEDTVNIDGVTFRFIDTAGIRRTDDTLEGMGIERSLASIGKARIILYMVDAGDSPESVVSETVRSLTQLELREYQLLCVVINKIDSRNDAEYASSEEESIKNRINELLAAAPSPTGPEVDKVIAISAKKGLNVRRLTEYVRSSVDTGAIDSGQTAVSNIRHYEALLRAGESLGRAEKGLSHNIPADLLSQDIREAIHHIGTITGEITTDEILGSIFSKFCIGK